jgi:hypothetical protein
MAMLRGGLGVDRGENGGCLVGEPYRTVALVGGGARSYRITLICPDGGNFSRS